MNVGLQMDKDLIFAKINTIQNCLERIHATASKSDVLDSFTIQDVVALNLQRAVQAIIDMGAHLVAAEKLGIPQTQREIFEMLFSASILTRELTESMKKMVGFRNIAVHDYRALDPMIMERIVRDRLIDLEEFCRVIIRHYDL